MKRSPIWIATSIAILMLAGSFTAASAQSEEEHETHHPDGSPAAESRPAPQASPDEEQPGVGGMEQDGQGMMGQGMMGQGMMGSGMGMNPEMMQMMQQMMGERQGGMGPDMMAQRGMGMMGRGGMMRAMFAIMDADGDGALSREEFQEAHGRIFSHMDGDGDGQLTLEEMQAFMGGSAMRARQMPVREGRQMEHTLSESAQAYMEAMQTMMDGMASMEMTGDPARDFALMMIPHHQSAVDMAEAFLQHSSDPELTKLANEIVSAQQEEIEFLQNWLGQTH